MAIRTQGSGAALGLLCAIGINACAPPATENLESATSDSSNEAVPAATSINAIMVGLVDHAAHELWDLGRDGYAPETEDDWDEVTHHAIQLAAAGSAITSGGTGPLDGTWVAQSEWRRLAGELSRAGAQALTAANERDLERVLAAGDVLVEVCEACHLEYKLELPTEGIVHPHR